MRWYRRLLYRVYLWSKERSDPEDDPGAWAIYVMGALLGLNAAAIFLIYFHVSGHGIPWLLRAAKLFSVCALPAALVYVFYVRRRLPEIEAEFGDPDAPSMGGPGRAFLVYVLVSIALFVVALVMLVPAAKPADAG
jgi:hypothetical protein